MGITLIMWKKSPLDRKIYPPEKILSFICFTEPPPPPQKSAFQDKSFFQNMLKTLCANKICVNEPHSHKRAEQTIILYSYVWTLVLFFTLNEYKKFLWLDIWDARFTIQGLWELISNHFTTKNTIYSHSFFSCVFKNAAIANL